MFADILFCVEVNIMYMYTLIFIGHKQALYLYAFLTCIVYFMSGIYMYNTYMYNTYMYIHDRHTLGMQIYYSSSVELNIHVLSLLSVDIHSLNLHPL